MAKSKKVNKWEAAPESIKLLHNAFAAFNTMSYEELDDKVDWDELDELLVDVLRSYNELEAKHNADCGLISKLEEENKSYKTLAAELHNDTDELGRTINNLEEMVEFHKDEVKKLVKTADQVRDKHENEVCMLKKDVHDLEVKVKYYKEDIEDLECEVSKYKALYEGADKQDEKIADLKSKLDRVETLLKFEANGKNMVYKKIETLGKELKAAQRKHEKATRFISHLTEALNDAGVEFHYVKFGGDGEEIFHIDSLIDKLAKKHYEEQFSKLRDTIKNYEEHIRRLCKDIDASNNRTGLLFLALDRAGIHPIFDNRSNKWCIQYTGKAENAFLAADQIKRDAEKKIDKLVSALDMCRLDAKWDHENDKWCIYVRPSDTELTSVSVNLCEVIEGYEKLKEENKTLILEKENLKSKNRSWQVRYNDVKKKVEELAAVNEGLNDYVEALKKKLNAIYGYRDTDNACGICKNFDPKE